MKNILDLRFIIALFFGITGLILIIASLVMHTDVAKSEATNFWSGIVYVIFSILMFVLWRFGKHETDEPSSEE